MNWKVAVVFSAFVFLSLTANPLHANPSVGPPVVNKTVLLNDESRLIPLKDLDVRSIAVLLPLSVEHETFADQLARYTQVTRHYWSTDAKELSELDKAVKFFNTLIVALPAEQFFGADPSNRSDFQRLLDFISLQSEGKDLIVWVTGSGRILRHFDAMDVPLLWTATDDNESLRYAAMSIFGGMGCHARLEADFSEKYRKGAGANTVQTRICYTGTERTPVNGHLLSKAIDGIMAEAIRARATPGGVVMVVQDGNVLFEKAYGHHTYETQRPTLVTDIFDVASITKIAATTPVVMRLVEMGRMDLDKTIGHYLWQAVGTNKEDIRLRDLLLHEAGLVPYIPFFRNLAPDDLRTDSGITHAVKLADGRFLRTGYYENVMWPMMLESELKTEGQYVYSDIGLYIMKEIAEQELSKPIDEYVQEAFYRPLGMYTSGYNPRRRFDRELIVPTEDDRSFRRTLLEGYVHDEGAAMAGGVAGHAGLFATANDLAIFGQMLLNRGHYGGDRYFQPETVDWFTARQSAVSRRGLGFDRREHRPGSSYPSAMASRATFGHTGYTGTALWVDPEKRLVFVFLSNRVHPQVSSQLSDRAIRRRILDVIYVALR